MADLTRTDSGGDDSDVVAALRARLAGLVPPQIDAAVVGMRRWIAAATEASFGVLHRSLSVFPLYVSVHSRVCALPIVELYRYMWRVDPALFTQSMFANYALPLMMEAMPWYLSRRKISKLLRESRNSITHRLVANEAFSDGAIGQFVLFSIVYAFVQTVEQVIRTRVLVANRLLIKRLVLERILYSELGSLQERYLAVFGEEVRTEQLEAHVFNDINETLNLFNNTLPSMLRGSYTLALSSYELYQNKEAFDVLAILRPSIVGLVSECVNWARDKYIVDAQTVMMQRNASEMSRVVSNIVDGLAEIQTNNLQQFQLRKLDGVSRAELSNQQGTHTFINSIYRQVSNRSVFDFASEVYVVRWVMQRRRINHETFRKVQNDIDYVTRLFGRMWGLGRDGVRVMDTQSRVIALLNLPSFIAEQEAEERRRIPSHAATPPTLEVIPESEQKELEQAHDGAFLNAMNSAASAASQVAAGSSASAIAAPASAEFNFQTLLFRRCLFRYKPDLPLALNIHPRGADEPLPTDELDALQPSHPRSTVPSVLMAEIAAVLASAPPPSSVVDPTLPAASGSAPLSIPSPHRRASTSAMMDEMMESRDLSSSEDEADDTVASVPSTSSQRPAVIPSLDDPELRDLEDFVREQQEARVPLRFRTQDSQQTSSEAAPRTAVDTAQDEAIALAAPTPSPTHSRSPLAAPERRCEPGTLLLERGKTYALIGQNRSGKSTLMQLLCKLYRPDSTADCEILLNGSTEFTAVPRMSLRRHLSYIAQRPFIFPGTLEDNIRIGNTTATAREVEEAARMAGIFEMEKPKPLSAAGPKVSLVDRSQSAIAMQLKPWEQNRLKNFLMVAGAWMYKQWIKLHGFEAEDAEDEAAPTTNQMAADSVTDDAAPGAAVSPSPAEPIAALPSSSSSTPIHPTLLLETAERGSNLSGGFAQSVALARVFLRKESQLVILDEAMGQMDALKKREQIFPSLFRFVKEHNMTLILISHDVPLVCKLVDHVYVMAAGQVAQSGTHEQLMRDETGVYARLVGNEE